MISLSGVSHAYRMGRGAVRALDRVALSVPSGSVTALLGPSGSGKSTLLHLIGGIERCQAGEIVVDDWTVSSLGPADLARYRRAHVGFVFQAFHLLPTLTAVENVEVPLVLAGQAPAERRRRALALLEHVGLTERAGHRPDQLSGGEQQRVAVARALVHGPRLLLADEPTGNLDSETGARIVELLLASQREQGCTVVIATHNETLAERADQRIRLRDGRIQAPSPSGGPP
ncbi:MAG TPA: ABC transporter ATP-binding protein [Chloroflexota bacterium]|nr:ABC transporter ATP-binding protein [Chloroflexota bacterium]